MCYSLYLRSDDPILYYWFAYIEKAYSKYFGGKTLGYSDLDGGYAPQSIFYLTGKPTFELDVNDADFTKLSEKYLSPCRNFMCLSIALHQYSVVTYTQEYVDVFDPNNVDGKLRSVFEENNVVADIEIVSKAITRVTWDALKKLDKAIKAIRGNCHSRIFAGLIDYECVQQSSAKNSS